MSEVRVNKLSPRSGTTVTLGDSGDTITIPTGVTLANSGTIDNLNASNLTSGTVPDGRITGAYTGITNLTMSGDLTVDTNTLYVDSTNNRVGIGTSSPDEKLTVSGDMNVVSGSTYKIKAQVSSSYALNLGHDRMQIVNAAANPFLFYYGSTEKIRIDSSGNVLVGSTSYQGGASSGTGGQYIGTAGSATAFARNSANV